MNVLLLDCLNVVRIIKNLVGYFERMSSVRVPVTPAFVYLYLDVDVIYHLVSNDGTVIIVDGSVTGIGR